MVNLLISPGYTDPAYVVALRKELLPLLVVDGGTKNVRYLDFAKFDTE